MLRYTEPAIAAGLYVPSKRHLLDQQPSVSPTYITPKGTGSDIEATVLAVYTGICTEIGEWVGVWLSDLAWCFHDAVERSSPTLAGFWPCWLDPEYPDEFQALFVRKGVYALVDSGLLELIQEGGNEKIITPTEALICAFEKRGWVSAMTIG